MELLRSAGPIRRRRGWRSTLELRRQTGLLDFAASLTQNSQ